MMGERCCGSTSRDWLDCKGETTEGFGVAGVGVGGAMVMGSPPEPVAVTTRPFDPSSAALIVMPGLPTGVLGAVAGV